MAQVLLLDDDDDLRLAVEDSLREAGYDVNSCATAGEAIQAAEERPPDVMVVDWMLEECEDGVDVAIDLRGKLPQVPIVVITAMEPAGLEESGASPYLHRVLQKPFPLSVLHEAVSSALQGTSAFENVLEGDEAYFEDPTVRAFEADLLGESISQLKRRAPRVFSEQASVREAMAAMQAERLSCVLVTEDGTADSGLAGIFTERDILYRVIAGNQNPVELALGAVATRDVECLSEDATIAWALNKMAVGGFRHVPVIRRDGSPAFVVSIRDAVEFLADFFPDEILNLPPNFGPPKKIRRDGG